MKKHSFTRQTSSCRIEKEQNMRLQIYRNRGHAYFSRGNCILLFLGAVEKKTHRRRTCSRMPHRVCGNSYSLFHVPDFCRCCYRHNTATAPLTKKHSCRRHVVDTDVSNCVWDSDWSVNAWKALSGSWIYCILPAKWWSHLDWSENITLQAKDKNDTKLLCFTKFLMTRRGLTIS